MQNKLPNHFSIIESVVNFSCIFHLAVYFEVFVLPIHHFNITFPCDWKKPKKKTSGQHIASFSKVIIDAMSLDHGNFPFILIEIGRFNLCQNKPWYTFLGGNGVFCRTRIYNKFFQKYSWDYNYSMFYIFIKIQKNKTSVT